MFYHYDSTLYNRWIWNGVVKPYKDPFTKSKNKNNTGIDTLNTVNYGRHVNSPTYCSHRLNCLANILLLRLVGKTHTGNYCLISYPHNVRRISLWYRCMYSELSFLSIPSVKRRKNSKHMTFSNAITIGGASMRYVTTIALVYPNTKSPGYDDTYNHCTPVGNAGHLPWRMLSSAKRCWRTEKTEEQ